MINQPNRKATKFIKNISINQKCMIYIFSNESVPSCAVERIPEDQPTLSKQIL